MLQAQPVDVPPGFRARLTLEICEEEARVFVCAMHRRGKAILRSLAPPSRPKNISITDNACASSLIVASRDVLERPRRGACNYIWETVELHSELAGLHSVYISPRSRSTRRVTPLDDLIFANRPSLREALSELETRPSPELVMPLTTDHFIVPLIFSGDQLLWQLGRVPYLMTKDMFGLPLASSWNELCEHPFVLMSLFDTTFVRAVCNEDNGSWVGLERHLALLCRHYYGKDSVNKTVRLSLLKKVTNLTQHGSVVTVAPALAALVTPCNMRLPTQDMADLMVDQEAQFVLLDNRSFLYRYSSEMRWWLYDSSRTSVPIHHRHHRCAGSSALLRASPICVAGQMLVDDMDSSRSDFEWLLENVPRCPIHEKLMLRQNSRRASAKCTYCDKKGWWSCSTCSFALCKNCDARPVIDGQENVDGVVDQEATPCVDDAVVNTESSDAEDHDVHPACLPDSMELIGSDNGDTDDEADDGGHDYDYLRTSSRIPLLLVLSPTMRLARHGRTKLSVCHMQRLANLLNTLPAGVNIAYFFGIMFPHHYYMEFMGTPCCVLPLTRVRDTTFCSLVGVPSIGEFLRLAPRMWNCSTVYDLQFLAILFEIKLNLAMENKDNRKPQVHEFYGTEQPDSQPTDSLPMSEAEVWSWLRRMEGFLRRFSRFNIFHTTTANFHTSPGFAELSANLIASMSSQRAFVVNFVDMWHRLQVMYCEWAFRSPNSPIGTPNAHYIVRNEWQTRSAGNLPHIHCGVVNGFDQFDNAKVITSDVRRMFADCSMSDDERRQLMTQARSVLHHSCVKGRSRCMRRGPNGEEYCRVPRYPRAARPYFRPKELTVSRESAQLLRQVGEEGMLSCGTWMYESQGPHYAISPTVPALFNIMRSSSNTLATDGTLIEGSYLVGYMMGQEERAVVKTLVKKNAAVLKVSTLHAAKKTKRDHAAHQQSSTRMLSFTECVWYLMDFPFVLTTVDFESTDMGFAINRTGTKTSRNAIPESTLHREPSCCSMTEEQASHWRSLNACGLSVSKDSFFDLRPPCLRDVLQHPNDMLETCVVGPRTTKKHGVYDVTVDGFRLLDGRTVRVRSSEVSRFLDGQSKCLNWPLLKEKILRCDPKFVITSVPCVVYWSPVQPKNREEFAYFLIRRFGSFDNTSALLDYGLRAALRETGVFEFEENSTRSLLRRFLVEELHFWSRPTRSKMKILLECRRVLAELLNGDVDQHWSAVSRVEDLFEAAEKDFKEEWVHSTVNAALLRTYVPDLVVDNDFEVIARTPDGVNDDNEALGAVEDQNRVLEFVRQHLRTCKSPLRLLLLGAPGTGKSWLTFALAAQFYANGCTGIIPTTIATLRARAIGGRHAHDLFRLAVDSNVSVHQEVEKTLKKVSRSPALLKTLRQGSLLILDEISTFTGRHVAVIDHLLRRIRNVELPFGGMSVVANGDPFQLTVDASASVWRSDHFMAVFQPVELTKLIRSRCPHQREILQALRQQDISPSESFAIADKILAHATLLEADAVTTLDAPLILPTRKALEQSLKQAQENDPATTFTRESEDSIVLPSGGSRRPRAAESKAMEKVFGLRRTIAVQIGRQAKITMNLHDKGLSNGMYVTVKNLRCDAFGPNEVLIETQDGDELSLTIMREERTFRLSSTSVRGSRQQLPLVLVVGDTIHAFQGATMSKSVTMLSDSIKNYGLWQREQPISLLGRTRFIKNTCLASPFGCDLDVRDIRRVLVRAISCPAGVPDKFLRWAAACNLLRHEIPAVPGTCDTDSTELDVAPKPVCYVLFSQRRRSLHEQDFYWGSTVSVQSRLAQHNGEEGGGAELTKTGRPWVLLAVVSGFADYDSAWHFEITKRTEFKLLRRVEEVLVNLHDTVKDPLLVRGLGVLRGRRQPDERH